MKEIMMKQLTIILTYFIRFPKFARIFFFTDLKPLNDYFIDVRLPFEH